MKTFPTKAEAIEYMKANYSQDMIDYECVCVVYAGPVLAKNLGVDIGWYVDLEEGK